MAHLATGFVLFCGRCLATELCFAAWLLFYFRVVLRRRQNFVAGLQVRALCRDVAGGLWTGSAFFEKTFLCC